MYNVWRKVLCNLCSFIRDFDLNNINEKKKTEETKDKFNIICTITDGKKVVKRRTKLNL